MNKLDMAHQYAKIILERMLAGDTDTLSYSEIASDAYQLADAMQAEADKREKEEAIKSAESSKQLFDSLTKKPNGECAHFHTTLNRTECFDCGEVLKQDDWQPDWSVAPSECKYWAMDADNSANFFKREPEITNNNGWDWGDVMQSDRNHTYQGDWKQSLRKRPE